MPPRPSPASKPRIAVVLPGTGSDAEFARHAFEPALHAVGYRVIAVEPDPAAVVHSYHTALDAAAADGPILACGISIGAAVAVQWALRHAGAASAVLAALPAWSGTPGDAPAARSAAFTAAKLRAEGLDAVTEHMRAGSPPWLAETLTRSWRAQWPALPQALTEASCHRGPTADELAGLQLPVGIAAAVDDPVHPLAVAEQWCNALPRAALSRITLDDIGADPGALGHATHAALVQVDPLLG